MNPDDIKIQLIDDRIDGVCTDSRWQAALEKHGEALQEAYDTEYTLRNSIASLPTQSLPTKHRDAIQGAVAKQTTAPVARKPFLSPLAISSALAAAALIIVLFAPMNPLRDGAPDTNADHIHEALALAQKIEERAERELQNYAKTAQAAPKRSIAIESEEILIVADEVDAHTTVAPLTEITSASSTSTALPLTAPDPVPVYEDTDDTDDTDTVEQEISLAMADSFGQPAPQSVAQKKDIRSLKSRRKEENKKEKKPLFLHLSCTPALHWIELNITHNLRPGSTEEQEAIEDFHLQGLNDNFEIIWESPVLTLWVDDGNKAKLILRSDGLPPKATASLRLRCIGEYSNSVRVIRELPPLPAGTTIQSSIPKIPPTE